jgi:hypothetical protein
MPRTATPIPSPHSFLGSGSPVSLPGGERADADCTPCLDRPPRGAVDSVLLVFDRTEPRMKEACWPRLRCLSSGAELPATGLP